MRRSYHNFYRLVLGLLLLCLFTSAQAAVNVASLYRITVPVASQLPDQRDFAESDGFHQILIRLTSDPEIAKNPVIKSNLNRAEYYVRDYSYSPPSPSSSRYMMQIRYEQEDVVRLLKKASVPFWAESRPLTLAWLAVTDASNQTEIIGNDSTNDIYELVKMQSRRLGIALIFPVMDMNDISQVDTQNVMDVALPELRQASKRYHPDVLLIAQIHQGVDQVTGKWSLVMNSNQLDWQVSGKSMEEMVASAMEQISETMVRQYKVNAGKGGREAYWLKVMVSNVNGNDNLARVMQYLKGLAPVEKLQLAQVAGDRVQLYLLIGGTVQNFQRNAALGRRLILKASDEAAKKVTYQWVDE